jgi:hypothetical protein
MSQNWERPPIAESSISVVLLSGSSSDDEVKKTLHDWHSALATRKSSFELLVPATNAQDAQWKAILTELPQAKLVVDDKASEGVGTALKIGLAVAQHPLLLTVPAGYTSSALPALLKEIDLVDIVCGVRQSKQAGWKRRQFFSKAYQLFGIMLQDPECGLKLYRREVFERLPIQSKGSFVQIEILAKASFQNRILTEAVVEGPATEPASVGSDFWKVLNNPNFGQPPERVVEEAIKPMFTKNLPSAPVTPDQK